MKQLDNLEEIISQYDAVFCDVWGVLHNGISAFLPAVDALRNVRKQGKTVILITNSPRPHDGVKAQLAGFGIYDDVYDFVVTSGDATRNLIEEAPKKLFHIGPERDLALFDGLDVQLVEEYEATGIVCTGLFDDEHETPEDYADLLQRLRSRNLPFICANPDLIVHRGEKTLWCAGSLARAYALLGGRTFIAGKPHHPIYDLAMKKLNSLHNDTPKSRILTIGDGILTDVKGGEDYGLDVLYISGGIHNREYSTDDKVDNNLLEDFLKKSACHPFAVMWALK